MFIKSDYDHFHFRNRFNIFNLSIYIYTNERWF